MNTLSAGDAAPLFSLPDQDGKPVSLESLKGKKVLVYFYFYEYIPRISYEVRVLLHYVTLYWSTSFEYWVFNFYLKLQFAYE